MSTIVTRAGKGSPLTWNEVDNNFTNLNTDKLQSGNTAAALTITSATINGGTITGTALNGTLGATTPSTIAATSGTFSTTLGVTGVATLTAQPILNSLTASSAVATDASKGLVSVTNTGTGNNVLATSPTITGATLTTAALNGSLGATTPSTVVATSVYANFLTAKFAGSDSFGAGTFLQLDNAAAGAANRTWLTQLGASNTYDWWYYNGSTSSKLVTIDSSGNVGLGVTPSAWASGRPAVEIGGSTQPTIAFNGSTVANGGGIWTNGYNNGGNNLYKYTGTASRLDTGNGGFAFYLAPSGTAGNAITFTQAMTLDASGNLGVGTASPDANSKLTLNGASASQLMFRSGDANKGFFYVDGTQVAIGSSANIPLYFQTNASTKMTLDANGAVTIANTAAENTQIFTISKSGTPTIAAYLVSVGGWNGAASGVNMGRNSSTSRSISAGGSINASGADYAEYMTKAGDFTIAKGDLAGIDANGKLTNVFADAVSFVVKSTDPSYVGGDSWGNEETLGVTFPKQPVRAEDDTDETFADKEAQYVADKAIVDEALEAARQLVDRIAFAGQVPVNVLGATAGQYIIPVNDNGAIKGEAVSSPTFEQYQSAVGKVIAIESDGRARIIVKVA